MKAEQLRKSILQLAIQGKLVPQDPNDEPASVLLERIRAEKQQLIKEGKIKKDKNDSVIFKGDDNRHYEKVGSEVKDITEDLPFEIPDSWVWVRHNEIFEISGGSQPPKSKFISQPKTGYVRLYQIRDYGSNPQPIYIPENTASKVSKKGDILLARYGASLGKVFWAEDGAYNVAMARIIALFDIALINKHYLYYYYKSSIYQETIMGNARSAQAGFNKDDLSKMFFPLPPLTEQARIVAEIEKIDPLIAEYDKLEQQATKLDEEIYDKLKKSILQYAIQGKLVPQDPNDEPASVLLERIRAEKKAKLGKKFVDSYIYKGDDNCYYEHIAARAQDEPVEVPFDIPDNWTWAKLLDLGGFSSGKTPDMSEPIYWQNGNVQWFTSKDMKTKYLTESQLKITELAAGDMTLYPANTLLWVVRSGILKSSLPICILKQPATINQDIKAYQLYQSDMIDYVYYMLKGMEAIILDNYVKRITTVHSLKFDELISKLAIPIPPLAEQKRIVAKINEVFVML